MCQTTKQTRGRIIKINLLCFFNQNVLDMPVPAGIFAMNKSIANVHKLLDIIEFLRACSLLEILCRVLVTNCP